MLYIVYYVYHAQRYGNLQAKGGNMKFLSGITRNENVNIVRKHIIINIEVNMRIYMILSRLKISSASSEMNFLQHQKQSFGVSRLR